VYVVLIKSKLDMIPDDTDIFEVNTAYAEYYNWINKGHSLASNENRIYLFAPTCLGAYWMMSAHVFLWAIKWAIRLFKLLRES
jgi:hypothetical protein